VITKPEEHEINRARKRLLRTVVEELGWVLNDVEEDYGIDSNVQIFDGTHPTGAWFHKQLKVLAIPTIQLIRLLSPKNFLSITPATAHWACDSQLE
jgi:hypothetical protein